MGLSDVIADESFGFRLTLKRGELATFFASTAGTAGILDERRRWLDQDPAAYAVQSSGSEAVWREFSDLVSSWQQPACPPIATELGAVLLPDFVFLRRDATGVFRVTNGVVVFPTSWALQEKVGLTLAEIHAVVPGLNLAIGAMVDRFLQRLKPGTVSTRSNWGLAATKELNLHPKLDRPRLMAQVDPTSTWLRVEHQLLTALPQSGAILFGIRLALHPIEEVLVDADLRTRLHRALETMPDAVAAYKGLAESRPELLRLLR